MTRSLRSYKLAVLIIFSLFCLLSCGSGGPKKFVISESRSYEASLFRQNCAICHGPEAEGKTLSDGTVVPGLRRGEFKYRSASEIYRHISEGGNGMVPFRNQLTEREINMLVEFVQSDLRGGVR
ncbi:MAG: cytochrome c [Chloracidobacterium sp.]|nr:cytochrome c [Chloracidobacterium sp.]